MSETVVLISRNGDSADIPCNRGSIDKLDEHVLKMVAFGDINRKLPNEKEVHDYCRADIEMANWGKNYTKSCMTNREVETSRHVTNLFMFSIKKVFTKRCRSETTRSIFIKAGKCANLAKPDTVQCYDRYTTETEQVNRAKKTIIKNDRHLIPLICCSYHRFHDCVNEAWAKTNDAEPCNKKAQTELDGYVTETMYDILQYLCGDYQDNNDKCDNLLKRYKDVFTSVKLKSLPKSPLSASNEIFDSIPPL
ncbi:unnamed protein product [Medioppia subpectinata]|uniref:Uncharacterized protein n=1 Tax=Medioppia subpectinata TaxID=1979941 RepID=A0A7R9L4S7_9ACAR|nr:unnamed protein product [Medioppia subpectinata]CAG2114351.1 unnamed protein product [Medioppia subpectinata]